MELEHRIKHLEHDLATAKAVHRNDLRRLEMLLEIAEEALSKVEPPRTHVALEKIVFARHEIRRSQNKLG